MMILPSRWSPRGQRARGAALAALAIASAAGCGQREIPAARTPAPVSVAVSTPAPALPEGWAERLAGCYALFDHRGRPASDSLPYAPGHARLETTPWPDPRASGWRGAWTLTKLGPPLPGPRQYEVQFWAADSLSDSVHVVFGGSFTGSELIVAPGASAGTLSGRARISHDHPPFHTDGGSVTAVREPCTEVPGTAP